MRRVRDEFEEYLASSIAPRPACPACGSTSVTRLYSSFATKWKPSLVNWHRMPGNRGKW